MRYLFTDVDGDVITVQPDGYGPRDVYIRIGTEGVVVPPADVPALVAAIRIAAGLED